MYRDAVEQATRDDITAAAAVHRELGPDYDAAVAESLVDRIGTEIDKRIDARLDSPRSGSRSPEQLSWSGRSQAMWTGVGVGAAIAGLVAIIANNGNSGPNSTAVVSAVIWVWVLLGIAALGVGIVRRHRSR
jgi:hypothetical protein